MNAIAAKIDDEIAKIEEELLWLRGLAKQSVNDKPKLDEIKAKLRELDTRMRALQNNRKACG